MPSLRPGRASARLTLRADARELRALRRQLLELFDAHNISQGISDDLILVANELATNAIEASALGSDIVVEVEVDRTHVTIAVENVGKPFTLPDEVTLPPKTRTRGRGLALTMRVADALTAQPLVDGTRVVAKCRRSG